MLRGGDPPLEQVRRALHTSQRLLVLDNLEHLLPAVPLLEDLLQACPGLRLIATSRVRCGAQREQLLSLQGLPFPDEAADAERAEAFDAVRLFAQRAGEVQSRFQLDAQRAGVVALCARVEGMPLALELAAAWTRHFSVAEIVRDLQVGGEMLDTPLAPGLPARQRSMAAVFDYSWQMLVPAERDALAALAVFRGGFTREAAQFVAGARLALLTALLDKSLVRRDELPGDGPARFSLHPLLQQFAQARLALAPDRAAQVQAGHAEYFVHQLAQLPPAEQAAARAAWCRTLRPDVENAVAAWRWALAGGRTDLLSTATAPLRYLHYVQGRWADGVALLQAAEAALAGDALALARLDVSLAVLLYYLGRCEDAVMRARGALRALRRAGDGRLLRMALLFMGQSLVVLGRMDAAHACYEQALRSARAEGERVAISDSLGNLGGLEYLQGRYDSACRLLEETAELRTALGGEVAMVLNNLGLSQIFAGRPREALATLAQALRRTATESNPGLPAYVHHNLALAHLKLGDGEAAASHAARAEQFAADGLAPLLRMSILLLQARISGRRGEPAAARGKLLAATREARQCNVEPMQAETVIHWAEWLVRDGQPARAMALLAMALRSPVIEHAQRLLAEEILAEVRSRCDTGDCARAQAEGEALQLADVIDDLLALP